MSLLAVLAAILMCAVVAHSSFSPLHSPTQLYASPVSNFTLDLSGMKQWHWALDLHHSAPDSEPSSVTPPPVVLKSALCLVSAMPGSGTLLIGVNASCITSSIGAGWKSLGSYLAVTPRNLGALMSQYGNVLWLWLCSLISLAIDYSLLTLVAYLYAVLSACSWLVRVKPTLVGACVGLAWLTYLMKVWKISTAVCYLFYPLWWLIKLPFSLFASQKKRQSGTKFEKRLDGLKDSYFSVESPPKKAVFPVFVGDVQMGYASCVKMHNNTTALLTANHVFALKGAVIRGANGSLKLSSFTPCYQTLEFDTVLATGPPAWTSIIGCKALELVSALSVTVGPVTIFTLSEDGWEGRVGKILGSNEDSVLRLALNTLPGYSGTPLVVGNKVVGVHSGSALDNSQNCNHANVIFPIPGLTSPAIVFETYYESEGIFEVDTSEEKLSPSLVMTSLGPYELQTSQSAVKLKPIKGKHWADFDFEEDYFDTKEAKEYLRTTWDTRFETTLPKKSLNEKPQETTGGNNVSKAQKKRALKKAQKLVVAQEKVEQPKQPEVVTPQPEVKVQVPSPVPESLTPPPVKVEVLPPPPPAPVTPEAPVQPAKETPGPLNVTSQMIVAEMVNRLISTVNPQHLEKLIVQEVASQIRERSFKQKGKKKRRSRSSSKNGTPSIPQQAPAQTPPTDSPSPVGAPPVSTPPRQNRRKPGSQPSRSDVASWQKKPVALAGPDSGPKQN